MTPFMPQRLLNSQTLHSLTASLTVYSLRLYAPTFGEPCIVIPIYKYRYFYKKFVVLGNVANSRPCEQSPQWELKSFAAQSVPAPVTASGDGRVWLLFGTDSGFEGKTEIYYTRISVTFTPV